MVLLICKLYSTLFGTLLRASNNQQTMLLTLLLLHFPSLFSSETRKIPWSQWTCLWWRRSGCRILRSSTWRRYIPSAKYVCPPKIFFRLNFQSEPLSSPPSTSSPSSRVSGSTGTWSWSTLSHAGDPSFLPPLHYRLSP